MWRQGTIKGDDFVHPRTPFERASSAFLVLRADRRWCSPNEHVHFSIGRPAVERYHVIVPDPGTEARPRRITKRGEVTRAHIIDCAADLMYRHGVAATTMDDVRIAADVSKSQLYRNFPDKKALIQAVIGKRAAQVLTREVKRLSRLDSIRGLELWRDALVQNSQLNDGAYGCALGSMANELSDTNDEARALLDETLRKWEQLLVDGFRRMIESGVLRSDADPEKLAIGMMAALQGGYLLAQAARDAAPMNTALNMAIDSVRALTPDAPAQKPRRAPKKP
jgi:TetR/AcrR family transcriptional repressor of nem operon